MATHRTWILIADGSRARVLERTSAALPFSAVADLEFSTELPRTHDTGDERPGRAHESHGATRHAYEPRSDAHDTLKHKFIAATLDALAQRHAKSRVDRLAIVAPPELLGVIRQTLPEMLQKILVGDLAKDLTKIPDHEIARHLPEDLLIKL